MALSWTQAMPLFAGGTLSKIGGDAAPAGARHDEAQPAAATRKSRRVLRPRVLEDTYASIL
jgi:hypothetical protein